MKKLFLAVDVSLLVESLCWANCKITKSFGLQPVLKCGYGPRQFHEQYICGKIQLHYSDCLSCDETRQAASNKLGMKP